MATKLFPMYCGLPSIDGMSWEKYQCDVILRAMARPKEKLILLIKADDEGEWIYGQCNFIHEAGHVANFKFCNSKSALRDQGVIPSLINKHGVDAVLFTSPMQYEWFRAESALRKYKAFFSLLNISDSGFSRT